MSDHPTASRRSDRVRQGPLYLPWNNFAAACPLVLYWMDTPVTDPSTSSVAGLSRYDSRSSCKGCWRSSQRIFDRESCVRHGFYIKTHCIVYRDDPTLTSSLDGWEALVSRTYVGYRRVLARNRPGAPVRNGCRVSVMLADMAIPSLTQSDLLEKDTECTSKFIAADISEVENEE